MCNFAVFLGKSAGGVPAFLGIGSRQADADSMLVDLEAQAALLVIVGLPAQSWVLGGVCTQPLFSSVSWV